MTSETLSLQWREAQEEASFLALGDVRDVLYSRAKRVQTLPASLTHGFGLLSSEGPAGAGEGIALRGLAALTPPGPTAGRLIKASRQPVPFETPFFLGWKGEPSAVGRFQGSYSLNVNALFAGIFERLRSRPEAPPLVFLELLALFHLSRIQDRVLCRPVHTGNVLITGEDHAEHYFQFNPVGSGSFDSDPLVLLAIAGAGFRPTGSWDDETEVANSIFYQPPQSGTQSQSCEQERVCTHSHALVWQSAEKTVRSFEAALIRPGLDGIEPDMESILSGLLEIQPSHLVHLDDWSRPQEGLFRVFVPHQRESLELLQF